MVGEERAIGCTRAPPAGIRQAAAKSQCMEEIDWSDPARLKAERPALVLELMSQGDVGGFVQAVRAGFDVSVASDVGGAMRTPAHHAAAAGDVEALRLLVEHGANLSARDPEFDATPLGWAEFFDKPEAADYLRSVQTGA